VSAEAAAVHTSSWVSRRPYGSVRQTPKFDERRGCYPRLLQYAHLRGIGLRHPDRQVRQRSVSLRNNIRAFLSEAVRTPDAELLTVSRMEAIVDGDLKELRMGSMSLACRAAARVTSLLTSPASWFDSSK